MIVKFKVKLHRLDHESPEKRHEPIIKRGIIVVPQVSKMKEIRRKKLHKIIIERAAVGITWHLAEIKTKRVA